MGLAFSYLGIRGAMEDFLSATERMGLTLTLVDEYEEWSEAELDIGETETRETIGAKEFEGALYIWGETPEIAHALDFAVTLSGEMDCVVVSGCAQTASGYFLLCYAASGTPVRVFKSGYLVSPNTFEQGEPLPSEARQRLDDATEEGGVLLALESLGFDFTAALAEGPYTTFEYSVDAARRNWGPLDQQFEEHIKGE